MIIETDIKVSYKTVLGDSFYSKISKRALAELIEKHIQDYCEEFNIGREDITIIRQRRILNK